MALEHNIIDELKEGRIVKLGRLGNFQVGINSSGSSTAEEVSVTSINKSHILFRPGKRIREMLTKVSFRKAG